MYKCNKEAGLGCAWFVESPLSTQAWIKQYLSWVCENWLIAHRVKNTLFGQHHEIQFWQYSPGCGLLSLLPGHTADLHSAWYPLGLPSLSVQIYFPTSHPPVSTSSWVSPSSCRTSHFPWLSLISFLPMHFFRLPRSFWTVTLLLVWYQPHSPSLISYIKFLRVHCISSFRSLIKTKTSVGLNMISPPSPILLEIRHYLAFVPLITAFSAWQSG